MQSPRMYVGRRSDPTPWAVVQYIRMVEGSGAAARGTNRWVFNQVFQNIGTPQYFWPHPPDGLWVIYLPKQIPFLMGIVEEIDWRTD